MTFVNERVLSFKSYKDLRNEIFSKSEISELDIEIKCESNSIRSLQKEISKEISIYMAKEKIGFNEFAKRLGTSSRQTGRIIKQQANINLLTLAEIAYVLGKRPRLSFE